MLRFVDADAIGGLRVVVDGGNGMAGPTIGPILERARPRSRHAVLDARRRISRTTSPTRCCRRTASSIIGRVRESGADLGIAFDGDADRCFFIDETGEFIPGDFITALLAGSLLRTHPGAAILYDVRASRAVAGHRRGRGRAARSATASGTPSSSTRMRDRGLAVRRRGLRPLLLPRLLLRRLRHDPGAADARAVRARRPAGVGAAGPLPRALLHLRRDQQRGRRPGGEAR